jgi:O-antigen/teichoic acid export membrane protein
VEKPLTFVKDVSTNFVKKTVLLVSGIITSIIIARVLGPTGKGIYAMVLLVPSMLLLLGEFGITMANIFYIGKKKIKRSVLSYNSLVLGLINGLFLIFAFLLIYPFIQDSVFKGVDSIYIYFILIIIPFSLATQYLSGILVGLLKIRQACYITIIQTIINTAGVATILLILSGYIMDLLVFSMIMTISLFVFYVLYIEKLTGFTKKFTLKSFKKCFNYGSKGYLADMFMFFNYRLDMFMINFFIGITAVGYYSISVGLAEMMKIVPRTIGFVLFPAAVSTNKKDATELTAATCRHSFFLSLILCIVATFFGKYAIEITYGEVFLPAYLPLLALLPGMLISSTGALTSAYLNGIGKVIYSPIITSTELTINIVLNIILIPIYGILGAAIASSICYSYGAVLGVFFFLKNSDITLKDVYLIKKSDLDIYIDKLKKYYPFN